MIEQFFACRYKENPSCFGNLSLENYPVHKSLASKSMQSALTLSKSTSNDSFFAPPAFQNLAQLSSIPLNR